jgi:hypothetical protein
MTEKAHLLDGLTPAQIAGVRLACEASQHYFTRLMFKALEGHSFRVGQHHELIDHTLDRVVSGEVSRLIVNEPPGYSKTLQCVIMFVARGFALNPRAKFLHTSYAQDLVHQNSASIRDVMALPEYQALWPRALRADMSAKGLWRTPEGGSFKASSAGGALTGFRAGTMDSIVEEAEAEDFLGEVGTAEDGVAFTGALIIDDPLKPDDASSDVTREFINSRYMNTFRSRLAHEGVPIVVIMQRIHQRDFSNHLLTGGGGEKFHHLMLPVEIDHSKGYPSEYTHGVQIKHNLPDGPLWKAKHTEAQIDILRRDGRVFSAQYMQDPRTSENAIFKATMFRPYEVRPRTLNVGILVDPSDGATKKSDRTAMAVIGIDANGNKYLLDGVCHRMNLSERWANLKRLYQRWSRQTGVMGVTVGYEKVGMQSDLAYIQERQQVESAMFPIAELNWPRSGGSSKEDRIQRLEPDFNASRFFLPATIWHAGEGGPAFWSGTERGIVARKVYGTGDASLTASQRTVTAQREAYRCSETLKRQDADGQLYDLSMVLMEELMNFPNAAYDDLSDAVSRIYDLDIVPANRREVNEVADLNDGLVA